MVEQLRNNDALLRFIDQHKLNWSNYPELKKDIYSKVMESEEYIAYMEAEENSYADDKKLITYIYTSIIFPNELLSDILEEQSIYWNDDLEFITSMIVKTFKKFKEEDGSERSLMGLYKNPEDRDYVVKLFRQTILNRDEYVEYIKDQYPELGPGTDRLHGYTDYANGHCRVSCLSVNSHKGDSE